MIFRLKRTNMSIKLTQGTSKLIFIYNLELYLKVLSQIGRLALDCFSIKRNKRTTLHTL